MVERDPDPFRSPPCPLTQIEEHIAMEEEEEQTFCNGYAQGANDVGLSKVIISHGLYVRGCSIAEHPSLLKHPHILFVYGAISLYVILHINFPIY